MARSKRVDRETHLSIRFVFDGQAFLRDYPSGKLDKQTFVLQYRHLHPSDDGNIE